MKKLTIMMVLMLVVALTVPTFADGHGSFSDVPGDHWAYNAINKLVAAGIVEGYPDGEYKGQQSMTRYEMAVMVSRALDNISNEMEAMSEGLTTGQAEDVTAIVKSLMEKNMPENDTLSDGQAEEVADIVDALTFELKAELKVLGADLDALGKDVDALEAKVEAMDVPEDNIEFGMDVTTTFEVADYGDEPAAAFALWADGDALDIAVDGDEGDFPAEKAFFQEYDFTVMGEVSDAKFNLAVDTISNVFSKEDTAFDDISYNPPSDFPDTDSPNFAMDTALLTVEYGDFTAIAGDHDDASVAPYFIDEEDLDGLAVLTNQFGWDWNFLVATWDDSDSNFEDDIYGFTAAKEMDFGTVTGRAYQVRQAANQHNVIAAEIADVAVADAVTVGGEVVFNDDGTDSDTLFGVNGEFAASDALTVTGGVEVVGEDFNGYADDLSGDGYDYNKFDLGASYVLNENNTVSGSYSLVQPGDTYADSAEDESSVEVALANVYGDFTNDASVEYTMNDGYADGSDETVVKLATSYAWNETTTLGASLTNVNQEIAAGDVISYNYLKGTVDKELSDAMTWNTTVHYINGTVGAEYLTSNDESVLTELTTETDGTGSALTTSLSVSF